MVAPRTTLEPKFRYRHRRTWGWTPATDRDGAQAQGSMSDDKVVVVPYSKKLVGDYQGQEKKDVLWLQGGLLVCEAANQKTYNSCGCEEEHGNHHQLMPLDHITTTNVARLTQKQPSLLFSAMLFALGLPFVVQQYDLGVLIGGAVVMDQQCLRGRTGEGCQCVNGCSGTRSLRRARALPYTTDSAFRLSLIQSAWIVGIALVRRRVPAQDTHTVARVWTSSNSIGVACGLWHYM